MALELKILISSFNRSTHTATVDDITGAYNVTTNPGGYGAPNPERSSLALVISSISQLSSLESVQWGVDPLTDTSIDYVFLEDGVNGIYLCAIEFEPGAFDPGLMSIDRVFYSVQDDAVYKVISGSSGNEVVATNDVKDNALHVSAETKYLVTSRAEQKRVDFFCADVDDCVEGLSDEYIDLVKTLEVSKCFFEEGNYIKSAEKVVFLTKIDKS